MRIIIILKKVIIVVNIYEASLHASLWANNYLLRAYYVLDTILSSVDSFLNKIAIIHMLKEFAFICFILDTQV